MKNTTKDFWKGFAVGYAVSTVITFGATISVLLAVGEYYMPK